MISVPDRRIACQLIAEANQAGAHLHKACAELEIHLRTYRRWWKNGEIKADARPEATRPPPSNKLSTEERAAVLEACHRPEFASLPPSQIVPALADSGVFLASESTFYRVLRAANEQHHRGYSRPPQKRKTPTSHCATAPNQVWSWDITYLVSPIRGQYYYLYLILDIYSRKVVGWEVHDRESTELAAEVVQRAVMVEQCRDTLQVLHADNGSPMKGSTLRATLQELGIEPSYSRPRVSNDNPYSEATFRTLKYRPNFPQDGFTDLVAARTWVYGFVSWYNERHRHSGIRFVTPNERHDGREKELLAKRAALYAIAKEKHPGRWTGETRNWTPEGEVWLNPERSSG
jgi:putative transposase